MKEKNIDVNASKERNIVSQGTIIKGSIVSDGDFRFDGKLEGDITIKGKLVIGKTGIIDGNINTVNLDSEGIITGNIMVEDLFAIRSTSVINGDVKTARLVIENGAIFNVKCSMSEGKVK